VAAHIPAPSLTAFDAPTREETTCERTRSNIPQQALVLLNDPTYVEAARVFATRVISEGGTDTASRLTFAFETALDRKPTDQESQILTALYESIYPSTTKIKTPPESSSPPAKCPCPTNSIRQNWPRGLQSAERSSI